MFVTMDAASSAQENFGDYELGDKRRRARLVRIPSNRRIFIAEVL